MILLPILLSVVALGSSDVTYSAMEALNDVFVARPPLDSLLETVADQVRREYRHTSEIADLTLQLNSAVDFSQVAKIMQQLLLRERISSAIVLADDEEVCSKRDVCIVYTLGTRWEPFPATIELSNGERFGLANSRASDGTHVVVVYVNLLQPVEHLLGARVVELLSRSPRIQPPSGSYSPFMSLLAEFRATGKIDDMSSLSASLPGSVAEMPALVEQILVQELAYPPDSVCIVGTDPSARSCLNGNYPPKQWQWVIVLSNDVVLDTFCGGRLLWLVASVPEVILFEPAIRGVVWTDIIYYSLALLGPKFAPLVLDNQSLADSLFRTVYQQVCQWGFRHTPELDQFNNALTLANVPMETFWDITGIVGHLIGELGLTSFSLFGFDLAQIYNSSCEGNQFCIVYLMDSVVWPPFLTFNDGARFSLMGNTTDAILGSSPDDLSSIALYMLAPNRATQFALNAVRMLTTVERIRNAPRTAQLEPIMTQLIDNSESTDTVLLGLVERFVVSTQLDLNKFENLPEFIKKSLEDLGFTTIALNVAAAADWLVVVHEHQAPLTLANGQKNFRLVAQTDNSAMLNLDTNLAKTVALYELIVA